MSVDSPGQGELLPLLVLFEVPSSMIVPGNWTRLDRVMSTKAYVINLTKFVRLVMRLIAYFRMPIVEDVTSIIGSSP